MNKAYNRINWENYPSDATPVNEQNLNRMDGALDEIDNRVITLDTTKATKTEVAPLIKEIEFNETNGVFTITRKNGSKFTIDTKLEKIAINFGYDPVTQKISLTLIDGTVQYIDLSALITQYEFMDTDTVSFFIDENGKISAIVKDGSITEDKLQPNYLAEIKVEIAKAEASATAAEASKNAAAASASTASVKAGEAATSAANAANSATTATEKATEAETSATNSAGSATSASNSATTATNKANAAAASATNAANSASTATSKADAAATSATNAAASATSADTYAKKSQSYAVGGTGTREGEDSDNAEYYYEQAKNISQGLVGALMPMGTVAFANLPVLSDAESGWMYNISNEFTTNSDFKEGSGKRIPAGANVYKTADGYWDVLAGTPVTTVNGQTGNVVIASLPANGGHSQTAVNATNATNDEDGRNIKNNYTRLYPTYGVGEGAGKTAYWHLLTIEPHSGYATDQYIFDIARRGDEISTVIIAVSSGSNWHIACRVNYSGDSAGGRVRAYEYLSENKTIVEVYYISTAWEDEGIYPRLYHPRGTSIKWDVRQVSALPTDATKEIVPLRLEWRGNAETATNADTVDGFHASGSHSDANTCVVRDGNGFTNLFYINSSTPANEQSAISQIITTNGTDNYYRKVSVQRMKSAIGLGNVDNTADANKSVNYANSAGSVAYSNVTGRPNMYWEGDVFHLDF